MILKITTIVHALRVNVSVEWMFGMKNREIIYALYRTVTFPMTLSGV